MDLDERRDTVSEIARQLSTEGVQRVVLVDGYHRIQARIENGEVLEVAAPRNAARFAEDDAEDL